MIFSSQERGKADFPQKSHFFFLFFNLKQSLLKPNESFSEFISFGFLNSLIQFDAWKNLTTTSLNQRLIHFKQVRKPQIKHKQTNILNYRIQIPSSR